MLFPPIVPLRKKSNPNMKVPIVFCRSKDKLSDYFFEIPGHPECSAGGNSLTEVQNAAEEKVKECIREMLESEEGLPKFIPISECVDHPEFSKCVYYGEIEVDLE
jgi:predicted RNase H-like HicB family nuclease